jgi:hypothetical protein
MTIAHPILAGVFLMLICGLPAMRSLRTGRLVPRGRGRTIYRRKRPGIFWSSIAVSGLFAAAGLALAIWGAMSD